MNEVIDKKQQKALEKEERKNKRARRGITKSNC